MISVGEIIYRIQENPLLRSVRKSDIVNHIKTIIELVGVPGMKQEKFIKLTILDYRAQLPSDFLERVTVRAIRGEDKIVLVSNTDEYAKFNKEVYGESDDMEGVYSHRIINGFIYTDFKEGEVELIYTAYYTDDNGWPMIPRNESLLLAIENYIKARHYSILSDHNAQFERSYQRAEQQYCWYVAQATASLLNLDPVEAQSLGNAIVRMIPLKDNFYTNNKYASQPERLNKSIW